MTDIEYSLTSLLELFPQYDDEIIWSIYYNYKLDIHKTIHHLLQMNIATKTKLPLSSKLKKIFSNIKFKPFNNSSNKYILLHNNE